MFPKGYGRYLILRVGYIWSITPVITFLIIRQFSLKTITMRSAISFFLISGGIWVLFWNHRRDLACLQFLVRGSLYVKALLSTSARNSFAFSGDGGSLVGVTQIYRFYKKPWQVSPTNCSEKTVISRNWACNVTQLRTNFHIELGFDGEIENNVEYPLRILLFPT